VLLFFGDEKRSPYSRNRRQVVAIDVVVHLDERGVGKTGLIIGTTHTSLLVFEEKGSHQYTQAHGG
jgi:hypothetical protein